MLFDAEKLFLVMFYIGFGLLIGIVSLLRKRVIRFDLLDLISAYFLLVFSIVPFCVVAFDLKLYGHAELLGTANWLAIVCLLTAYAAVMVGWASLGAFAVPVRMPQEIRPQKVKFLLVLGIGVSISALIAYLFALGGPLKALAIGARLRYDPSFAATFQVGKGASALYFINFALITFLFSFLKVMTSSHRAIFYWLCLLLSAAIVVYFGLVNSSRGTLVNLFLLAIMLFTLLAKRWPIKLYLIGTTFIAFFIISGKSFLSMVGSIVAGTDVSSINLSFDMAGLGERILLEFSHPMATLVKVTDERPPLTYFQQFYTAFLHLIPSRALGESFSKPETISYVNSLFLVNEYRGIPPGLPGSFYYSFGVLGVLVGMLSYGALGRLIQNICINISTSASGFLSIAILIFYKYATFVTGGDPKTFIQGNIFIVIALVFLWCVTNLRFGFKGCRAHELSKRVSIV